MESINIATFILDDDIDLLEIIEEAIREAGIYNYKLFTSEDAFIEGLNEEIHVCVVDHYLTKKTGIEILNEIKAKNKDSFVIAYSGIKDARVIMDYLNGGADKFVDKDSKDYIAKLVEYLKVGLEVASKRIKFISFLEEEKNKPKLIKHV